MILVAMDFSRCDVGWVRTVRMFYQFRGINIHKYHKSKLKIGLKGSHLFDPLPIMTRRILSHWNRNVDHQSRMGVWSSIVLKCLKNPSNHFDGWSVLQCFSSLQVHMMLQKSKIYLSLYAQTVLNPYWDLRPDNTSTVQHQSSLQPRNFLQLFAPSFRSLQDSCWTFWNMCKDATKATVSPASFC